VSEILLLIHSALSFLSSRVHGW